MTLPLHSDRLLLRPLAESDGALYRRLYTDPVVMQHVTDAQDEAAAARGFQASLRMNAETPNRRTVWVICRKGTGQDLGLIGLDRDGPGGAEVGVLLPPDQQDRGFASEAIGALADHAFDELGLARLHTRHAPDHALATGLMQSLGFERTHSGNGGHDWRWQLTPQAWAGRMRRQGTADPLP